MKKTTLAAGLLALAGMGSVGCKTTPKLAFWKSDKSADATVVVQAPTLPSDTAKLAAGGKASVAQAGGGEAAPFISNTVAQASTAGTTPSGYPSTDAPAFTPDVAGRIASSTATSTGSAPTAATSANLGSIAPTPYDPTRPPRASASTISASATTAPAASRYGASSTASTAPAYGMPAVGATAGMTSPADAIPGLPQIGGALPGSRYASSPMTPTSPTTTATMTAPSYGAAAGAVMNAATNRYGIATTAATEAATSAASAASAAVSGISSAAPTTAVATTAQPYRPGGTGTYPSAAVTQPPVQVATRPQDAAMSTDASSSTAPNVARPGDATTPSATGTTTPGRYW